MTRERRWSPGDPSAPPLRAPALSQRPSSPGPILPASIGGRYRVVDRLGRGGMAVVYRVADLGSGQELALKQLLAHDSSRLSRQATSLFEREFHTLAQLAHPRVIEVYDYGIDAGGPFYTMELLDGGDLKTLAPLDPKRACALMLEICSSLALIHARRLVHRDVSPRNIRCTRDGHAKLLDFGAMVPMGPCAHTVGTPAFIAPEVVHHSNLDARTDLFSLGATLYYTLTGRAAFPARQISELREAWSHDLVPPSHLVPGIPPAVDALCASLLRIDPAQRPRSAFELMHRLETVAGIEHSEPVDVSRAYLEAPLLIGRNGALRTFRQRMRRALLGDGGALIFESAPGLGRSRVLDACVLEAKTLGASVLRVGAGASNYLPYGAAAALCKQLVQVLPDSNAAEAAAARHPAFVSVMSCPPGPQEHGAVQPHVLEAPASDHEALLATLTGWLLEACETHALLIAVDDIQHVDEASLGLLAGLAIEAPSLRLLLVATSEAKDPADPAPHAWSVLLGHSLLCNLRPLTRSETEALLASVFGVVPHISVLAEWLYQVSLGSPRESLALAQHLVDTGLIRYRDGQWTLPAELEPSHLPASASEAFAARVMALPPLSRRLAEAQSLLGTNTLRREDYAALVPNASPSELDAAILALLEREIVHSDGERYVLSHRALADTLSSLLSDEERRERHLALHELLRRKGDAHAYLIVPHLLAAGRHEQALDLLAQSGDFIDRVGMEAALRHDIRGVSATLERALELAEQLERPPRETHELRRKLCMAALSVDEAAFLRAAPAWLARLQLDSGLSDYRALDAALDPEERLRRALATAAARHRATPVGLRVYDVEQALTHLALYVGMSLLVGMRALDTGLLDSLPELLEPFARLRPTLHASWQRARGVGELVYRGRRLSAKRRLQGVYARVSSIHADTEGYFEVLRNSVAAHVALIEAGLGRTSIETWLPVLDASSLFRVTAMHLRRTSYLMRGDLEKVAHFGKEAEALGLRTTSPRFEDRPWNTDLLAYALGRDLEGVKRVVDGIARRASRHPGWRPLLHLAQGHFQLLRGDPNAAHAEFERSLALASPERDSPPICIETWTESVAGQMTALLELGEAGTAVRAGRRALALCRARKVEVGWHSLALTLGVAEAKMGSVARAIERIEGVIAEQRAVGIRGLMLAASYEARARTAIEDGDATTATHYAALAMHERGGTTTSSALTYIERLIEEARAAGLEIRFAPSKFEASLLGTDRERRIDPQAAHVFEQLDRCEGARDRAQRALELVCDAAEAPSGHLFLVGESGELEPVAALRTAEPGEDMLRFARGFFAQQLEDEQMSSALSQPSQVAEPGVAAYIDASGKAHRLLVLSCRQGRQPVYAGLAVMDTERALTPDALTRCGALAEALMRAGDTAGRHLHEPAGKPEVSQSHPSEAR